MGGAGALPAPPPGKPSPGTPAPPNQVPEPGPGSPTPAGPAAAPTTTPTTTPARASQLPEAAIWLAVVGAGLGLAAVLVAAGVDLGTAAAPFAGHYRWHLVPASALAPVVAAAVLAAVRAGALTRLPWWALLSAAYLAALAWSLALAVADGTDGLAGPIRSGGYLRDTASIGGDPLGFVRGFTAGHGSYSPGTRAHPPGALLLIWSLGKIGIDDPTALGVTIAGLGCLTVPLVAVAVRSLCHDPAARRLLPALVLAPWAVWTAVAPDAVTAALAAAGVALGVVGSEPGRRIGWAAVSGLLLGAAALCGYSAAWLGIAVAATYFVRRRPLLNVVTGATALLPLWLFQAWGFSWPDGLAAAGADVTGRGGSDRAWLAWVPLELTVLAVACGPVLIRAARRVRMTPGWPFLAGAVPAVVLGVLTGMSRGEVERSWLPFFPWLVVAALAPYPRPAGPGDRTRAGDVPGLLIALGALTGIALQAALASPW